MIDAIKHWHRVMSDKEDDSALVAGTFLFVGIVFGAAAIL